MGLLFSRSEVRAPAEAAPVVVRALRASLLPKPPAARAAPKPSSAAAAACDAP